MESFRQVENEKISERIIDYEIQKEVEANASNIDITTTGGIVDVMKPADAPSFERSIGDTSEFMKSKKAKQELMRIMLMITFHFQDFFLTFFFRVSGNL
jgi:hypothetical protein